MSYMRMVEQRDDEDYMLFWKEKATFWGYLTLQDLQQDQWEAAKKSATHAAHSARKYMMYRALLDL